MDANDWQARLIRLYCFLCAQYRQHLWVHVLRLSPNAHPRFTDEEVLAVYLFGLLEQHRSLRAIHRFTRAHLRAWFPQLPSYQAFVHRLNQLDALLPALLEATLDALPEVLPSTTHVVDSMPIVLAWGSRAHQGRVARDFADLGYCATKKGFFHGVKLHALSLHLASRLPRPEHLWISPGSANDLSVLKMHEPSLPTGELYADKLYQDRPWQRHLHAQHQLALRTPVRRVRNQAPLTAQERLYSTAISRVRQPIEGFFAWLQERTQLQNASHVRSTSGLWVHLFGRLCAAFLFLLFNS